MTAAAGAQAAGAASAAEPKPAPRFPLPPGKAGPRNLITDVPGLKVGQADDAKARTGVTVILPDEAAIAAVDVRGGGPGTRETDALAPENLVHVAHAICLSGGSVYGLGAADGVCAWLGAQGRGYGMGTLPPGAPPSPIVPAAILFDIPNGGDKAWGLDPPYRRLGIAAVEAASDTFKLGTAGAGYGARSGGLKGGLGSASAVTADGITVGAIVAVNSAGSPVAPGTRQFWAAPFELDNEFGGLGVDQLTALPDEWGPAKADPKARQNTTIASVATDVKLEPGEIKRVAIMAQDGLARAIRPIHAPFDGDVVFALSTGKRELAEPRAFTVARIGALAADVLARAIARGVYEATTWPGSSTKAWRDLPANP
ncbi:P1 family peptidase [Phenylobacterium sp.]|uniref:P1 family peptidase n=1 Tax=Phenylobacterium sp. TaxID=1871053 RepID=UPI0035B1E47C